MKRRLFMLILALALLLCTLPVSATETTEPSSSAEPTEVTREPGYCGEDITWDFHKGTLTITGTGKMDDFPDGAPWQELKAGIVRVYISDGITYIGANAFRDYDVLLLVEFGSDVYEIGPDAFRSCDGLTSITLPGNFRVFGENCFMSCRNLKEFHCEGKFPSFRQNCLWDTYAVIYFPAERPWSVELIRDLEEAFHGRIEFLASDGTDPYVPTEPTEEPTEPPTEEPTTVPPTEEATQPTTVPPTETVTQPVPDETEIPTREPEQETEGTEETQEPEEKPGGTGWIGGLIIVLVLGLVLAGSMVFGGKKKGKYSR